MGPVSGYLSLAFGISWSFVGVGWLLGVRDTAHPGYLPLAAACMLGPAIAAVVRYRLIDRAPWSRLELHPRHIRWKGLLLTALAGLCIVPTYFLVVAVAGTLPGGEVFGEVSVTTARLQIAAVELMEASGMEASSDLAEKLHGVPAWAVLVLGLLAAVLAACTINLPFMLGEELGWRGYLFQHTAHWPAGRRILFTGVVWGLWHAPLIMMGHNYPGRPVLGIGMMVVLCVVLAVLFDHARRRSGSVWGPTVLHGLVNGTAGMAALFAWGGEPLVAGLTGAAGMLAVLLLVGLWAFMDRVAFPANGRSSL